MIGRPTRGTVEGRAYLDLQNLARRTGRPTDELHQIYALEGFLDRLAGSAYAGRLVLKGGVLLAAYDARGPTRDLDLQGRWISNSVDEVLGIVRTIAGATSMTAGVRRGSRYRRIDSRRRDLQRCTVTVIGHLPVARLTFHVDVNVGDPIWPAPHTTTLPRLLDSKIVLTGYPLAMVYA